MNFIRISCVYAYIPKTVVTFYSRIIHELYVHVSSVCCSFLCFLLFLCLNLTHP